MCCVVFCSVCGFGRKRKRGGTNNTFGKPRPSRSYNVACETDWGVLSARAGCWWGRLKRRSQRVQGGKLVWTGEWKRFDRSQNSFSVRTN